MHVADSCSLQKLSSLALLRDEPSAPRDAPSGMELTELFNHVSAGINTS